MQPSVCAGLASCSFQCRTNLHPEYCLLTPSACLVVISHFSPCDLVWLQANLYPRILAAMKPGATLGLSHGFLLGVLKNDGVDFRKDINVVLVAPKVGESHHRGFCIQVGSCTKEAHASKGVLASSMLLYIDSSMHVCEFSCIACPEHPCVTWVKGVRQLPAWLGAIN